MSAVDHVGGTGDEGSLVRAEIKDEIQKIIGPYTNLNTNKTRPRLNPDDYKEGLDLELMYQDMFLASEGYVYRMQQEGNVDVDKMLKDYRRIIDFWKESMKLI